MPSRRKFWGWGLEDAGPDPATLAAAKGALSSLLGMKRLAEVPAPRLEEISLSAPRIQPRASLARLFSEAPFDRALHTYGRSYRDLIRALSRDFSNPPDLVAFPETEDDVIRVLDWCGDAHIAVIPYGGGSSVCGGVEPDVGDSFSGTVSLDLGRLDRVLEIDHVSRGVRVQAGVFGPALEAQLKPESLSLRHYPQSFEFSSLGGWIATRSGGHFATLTTHIDDLVESLRVITPAGVVETRRLPGDGAGPSPERLFIGSEGMLGVITEAWMRVFRRPRFRASLTATFDDFAAGARTVRALAQSGLYPSNCRLLDPMEALLNGAGTGDRAVLLIGFESADHPLDAWLSRAGELARETGGEVGEPSLGERSAGAPVDAAGRWRSAFVRAPYLRDELVRCGAFIETFETAVTWDRFEPLRAKVASAATEAALQTSGGMALVTCRLTHAYPDGAAPYFTVLAPAARGRELEQWTEIKRAVTQTVLDSGGTVTHHHAVGRDVKSYYAQQVPEPYRRALAAAKSALDPAGILNPGALLPADGDQRHRAPAGG